MKDYYATHSHYTTYTLLYKGWENVLFELGRERAKLLVGSPVASLDCGCFCPQ